jgi:hypothetical protein
MRPSKLLPPLTVMIVVSINLLGCADDPPSPTLVEDLRVLAVKAEPPELLLDREELLTGAPRTAHFEALVVDPRGVPMVYDWQFCPVESSQTCGDYEQRRATADGTLAPLLDAARAQELRGPAQLSPEGTVGTAGFDVQIAPQLLGYHLQGSALGLGNGAWASAVLKLDTGSETLLAQKRLVLNARDLSAFNPELAAAGWQICDPSSTPALPTPAGCLPLRPRTPNHNPALTGIEVARGLGAPFAPQVGPLVLSAKEKVRLRPVLAADAEEPYQSIEAAFQGNTLVVVDHREELVVSWFTTAGTFADQQTAVQLNKTIDNDFTAPALTPAELPAGKPVALFVVVRDQRGGVGWTRLDAQVQ